MRKLLFICALLSLIPIGATFAQSTSDALLFNQPANTGGTARTIGVGGAFGALGGDVHSASVNPAGIGFFRRSEMTISPAIFLYGTNSDYWGSTTQERGSRFHIQNFGIAISNAERKARRGDNTNWRAVNFAFTIDRFNHLSTKRGLNGFNPDNSISDYFAQTANGLGQGDLNNYPFDAGLAWNAYVIDPSAEFQNEYVGIAADGDIRQVENFESKGATEAYTFALGANYRDRLYLGASAAFNVLRYESVYSFAESDDDDNHDEMENILLYETIEDTGIGLNAKLGFSYKINDNFRAGLAFHTPSNMSVSESYQILLSSTRLGQEYSDDISSVYEYNLAGPWRAVASAAYMLGRRGFISADYVYADYGQMKFSFDDNDSDLITYANQLNEIMSDGYKASHTVRVGSELVFNQWRARAGYSFASSPFEYDADAHRQQISLGGGFREKSVYVDAAYTRSFDGVSYQPYFLADEAVATADVNRNNGQMVLSVGFKF